MPELPDVAVYLERIEAMLGGRTLLGIDVRTPFLLRSVEPTPRAYAGARLQGTARLGKQLVLDFGDDLFAVLHLMIAGRLRWRPPGRRGPGVHTAAAFLFEHGTLFLTEASAKKRAKLHLVRGRPGLAPFDRGGLEVLQASAEEFAAALRRENRTVKRALTDPRLCSGIGNAYSDEILHRARLSPLRWTRRLTEEEVARLHIATRTTLEHWTDVLREEVGDGFPEKVTAFRPGMAVHGRYRQPCPDCGQPVQRIRYASNECNYCAQCQNGGVLLADRGLSQLLKGDWPRTLEELEERRGSP